MKTCKKESSVRGHRGFFCPFQKHCQIYRSPQFKSKVSIQIMLKRYIAENVNLY